MSNTMNTNTSNKDPVNIMYLGVTYQGESGGRLILQSHSMSYYSASGDRKAEIPWNRVGKLHTGATATSAKKEFLLKVNLIEDESLVFGLQTEEELDRIRSDCQRLVKAYHKKVNAAALVMNEPSFTSRNSGSINGAASLAYSQSQYSTKSKSSNSTKSSHQSQPGSQFQDEEGSLAPATRSVHSVHSNRPREITVATGTTDVASVVSGTTMRSGYAETEMMDVEQDPEAGTVVSTKSRKTLVVDPKSSAATLASKESGEMPPVATYRLVQDPEQAMQMMHSQRSINNNTYAVYPTKEIDRPKKMWHSRCFWLAIVLLALLLVGIGIGIGVLSGFKTSNNNNSNSNSKDTSVTEVVGLQDSTTAAPNVPQEVTPVPTQAPTIKENIMAAALERTEAPTTAPTEAPTKGPDACDGVNHGQAVNQRNTAIDAGMYGGSTFCRASIISICEETPWVQFSKFTGTSSAWFAATAFDDSFCAADVEHKIKLAVPAGVNYSLFVYEANSPIAHDSDERDSLEGGTREVTITSKDNMMWDDSFTYIVQVEYVSGSSCGPWTLEINGHECLYN